MKNTQQMLFNDSPPVRPPDVSASTKRTFRHQAASRFAVMDRSGGHGFTHIASRGYVHGRGLLAYRMNQRQFNIGRFKSGVNYFRDPQLHGFPVLVASPSSQQENELDLCHNVNRQSQNIVVGAVGNAFVTQDNMDGVLT